MALAPEALSDVARAIQLALAPVFLLTGIAGMLNVMVGRLARIIDRARNIAKAQGDVSFVEGAARVELPTLERRRGFASVAITACAVAALLVCMVVASLFLEVMLAAPLDGLIAVLFTGSMVALIVGLAYFLREVHLATQTIRIQIPEVGKRSDTGAGG